MDKERLAPIPGDDVHVNLGCALHGAEDGPGDMTSLDEASINSIHGTVFAGSGKLAAVCPIPALGSRPRLFVVASWPPVPLPLPWTTWNAHIGPCPMARAWHEMGFCHGKKRFPASFFSPSHGTPLPLFCQTVDISCGVGVVVAQADFFFFFWPRLWATHWAIL